MTLDTLRPIWPEPVLTGRYSVRTRRRDGAAQSLSTSFAVLNGGVSSGVAKQQFLVTVDGEPRLVVMKQGGIKVYSAGPAPVLVLRDLGQRRYEVVDHNLDTVIGSLHVTGGFTRPARSTILDPDGRTAGELVQPPAALVGRWLLVGLDRYTIEVDGSRVAQARERRRMFAMEVEVDVSELAGRLDPRLVLAAVLQRMAY